MLVLSIRRLCQRERHDRKRRFSRILYQAPATLSQGDKQLSTCIQDLSLHGLLLWSEDEPDLDTHALVDVVLAYQKAM